MPSSAHNEQRLTSPAVTAPDGEIPGDPGEKARADDNFWRQEVISRVQLHRARRRRRFDPHASMELDFQAGMELSAGPAPQAPPLPPVARQEISKIIQFPRQPVYFLPALASQSKDLAQESEDLELAEPIVEAPRILDAPDPPPEQMDLLPAFADIQLESEESRRALEVELPLQPAPVGHRLFAGLVDAMIVLMSGVLFAIAFVMFAHGLPRPRQSLFCGFIVSGSLWLIYQYLFLVYSSGTPGMYLAQLELCTFKGEPVSLSLRRWRALASLLSAFAVGLGFAWALVDEDTLGWHDRITQTHLRRSGDPVIHGTPGQVR